MNAGSGATTAHIASLLQDNNNHIWTFGSQSNTDVQKIQKTMERLGIKGKYKLLKILSYHRRGTRLIQYFPRASVALEKKKSQKYFYTIQMKLSMPVTLKYATKLTLPNNKIHIM